MPKNVSVRAELHSIVIIGAMNPRIHTPVWYKLIGAISEQEESAALASPSFVCVPPIARFEIGAITVVCHENRWEIIATQGALRNRCFDIAILVFRKLNETPIGAYGLNTVLQLETNVKNVGKCVADAVMSLNLGLVGTGTAAASIRFTDKHGKQSSQVDVSASSLSDDVVQVAANTEYRIEGEPGYFDVGEMLAAHFDADYELATSLCANVVQSLNERCGGI